MNNAPVTFHVVPRVDSRYEVCPSDTGRPVALRSSRVSATAVANRLTVAAREGTLSEAFRSLKGSR